MKAFLRSYYGSPSNINLDIKSYILIKSNVADVPQNWEDANFILATEVDGTNFKKLNRNKKWL